MYAFKNHYGEIIIPIVLVNNIILSFFAVTQKIFIVIIYGRFLFYLHGYLLKYYTIFISFFFVPFYFLIEIKNQ